MTQHFPVRPCISNRQIVWTTQRPPKPTKAFQACSMARQTEAVGNEPQATLGYQSRVLGTRLGQVAASSAAVGCRSSTSICSLGPSQMTHLHSPNIEHLWQKNHTENNTQASKNANIQMSQEVHADLGEATSEHGDSPGGRGQRHQSDAVLAPVTPQLVRLISLISSL